MPTPYSNFTTPDADQGRGGGPYSTGFTTDSRTGQTKRLTGAAGGYETEGQVRDDGSWGGYSATVHRDQNGNFYSSAEENGRQADVDRYQGMAAAAAQRDAYQNNYGLANGYGNAAVNMGRYQGDAAGLYRDAALGQNSQAVALGRSMLNQGAAAQQAAALSTRGGSMAQAAALQNQRLGQNAYYQTGQNQLEAIRANEMAAGRLGYANALGTQRAGDLVGQGLHQQQSLAQMQNEMFQRELNQKAQQGYEGMAFDVNKQSQNANLTNQEIDSGVQNTIAGINAADKARDMRLAGAGVSAVTSMGAGAIKAYGSGNNTGNGRP